MSTPASVTDRYTLGERGIALLMTLLLALLVVSLAIGVLLMMSNTTLITRFHISEATMGNLAMGGLEQARDTLNGTPSLLPRPTGHDTLEFQVPLRDASNTVIPNLTRSTFAGLTGNATGQLGLYATVLSVITSASGPVAIRRADLRQESFAAFSRFYNTWSCCSIGANETVFGPLHSNQGITLGAGTPGPVFRGPVTTVLPITNQSRGDFQAGVRSGVGAIPFPTSASIAALAPVAAGAGLQLAGYGSLSATDPGVRIEFVTIDINGDGDTGDENEGYFRVFRIPPSGGADERDYTNARRWGSLGSGWPSGVTSSTDPNMVSPNCGGQLQLAGGPAWMTADSIRGMFWPNATQTRDSIRAALTGPQRRCFLGGDRALFGNLWVNDTPYGSFEPWPGWGGSAPSALVAAISAQGVASPATAADVATTFWPLARSQNTASRGVIYVNGSVAVSGRLRGQVTLVATGNIVLADDITYVQPPNTNCADILGLISQRSIWLEDNNVNTPFRVGGNWTTQFDDTPDEFTDAFLMALQGFGGEISGSDGGVAAPEDCGNFYSPTSRGCSFLAGGIVQPGVGQTYSGTTGWKDQDTYDACGTISPPPYYPTTGRFAKYRYYDIDPVGFNAAAWFAANQ